MFTDPRSEHSPRESMSRFRALHPALYTQVTRRQLLTIHVYAVYHVMLFVDS